MVDLRKCRRGRSGGGRPAPSMASVRASAAGSVTTINPKPHPQVRALTGALQPAYWQALIVVSLLYFARFDPSFITLRAKLARPRPPRPCPGSQGAAHGP